MERTPLPHTYSQPYERTALRTTQGDHPRRWEHADRFAHKLSSSIGQLDCWQTGACGTRRVSSSVKRRTDGRMVRRKEKAKQLTAVCRRVAAVNCTGVHQSTLFVDSDKIYRLVDEQESMTPRNRHCQDISSQRKCTRLCHPFDTCDDFCRTNVDRTTNKTLNSGYVHQMSLWFGISPIFSL